MRNIRFGLAVIAVCGLIVLAAGIRVAVWVHQAEAISAAQEFAADQLLVLRRTMGGLLELDSSLRRYLLTGDAADLGSYDQARRDLAAALNRLDELFRDAPTQTADSRNLPASPKRMPPAASSWKPKAGGRPRSMLPAPPTASI